MAEYKEKQRAVFPAKTSLSLRGNDMEQIAIQEYLSYCEEKIMALYRPAGWKNYTSRPELLKSAFSKSRCIDGYFERLISAKTITVFLQEIFYIAHLFY